MKSFLLIVNNGRCAFTAAAFAVLAFTAVAGTSSAAVLRKSLAALADKDTVCKVWVIFTDKTGPAGGAVGRARGASPAPAAHRRGRNNLGRRSGSARAHPGR